MKHRLDMAILALIASGMCGCEKKESDSCSTVLEQTVDVRNAVRSLGARLEHFTIQPECAACPKPRTCPDDSDALARGDEALRQVEELREILKRYREDADYNYGQLSDDLRKLAGDD